MGLMESVQRNESAGQLSPYCNCIVWGPCACIRLAGCVCRDCGQQCSPSALLLASQVSWAVPCCSGDPGHAVLVPGPAEMTTGSSLGAHLGLRLVPKLGGDLTRWQNRQGRAVAFLHRLGHAQTAVLEPCRDHVLRTSWNRGRGASFPALDFHLGLPLSSSHVVPPGGFLSCPAGPDADWAGKPWKSPAW